MMMKFRRGRRAWMNEHKEEIVSELVFWAESATSRLKTMFSLSPTYSAHKSSNHKLSKNYKISSDTNLHETKRTQTSNTKIPKN